MPLRCAPHELDVSFARSFKNFNTRPCRRPLLQVVNLWGGPARAASPTCCTSLRAGQGRATAPRVSRSAAAQPSPARLRRRARPAASCSGRLCADCSPPARPDASLAGCAPPVCWIVRHHLLTPEVSHLLTRPCARPRGRGRAGAQQQRARPHRHLERPGPPRLPSRAHARAHGRNFVSRHVADGAGCSRLPVAAGCSQSGSMGLRAAKCGTGHAW